MPEDVHTHNIEALKAERASLDQQDVIDRDERKAEIDKQIARAERARKRGKRGEDAPETADHEERNETAVPPGPISKSRQQQQT